MAISGKYDMLFSLAIDCNSYARAFHLASNPDSYVINGLGRYDGGPKGPLAVVDVNAGIRYRFRLVNTACIAAFNFSIDSHSMTVIEVDGTETRPLDAEIVSLWPGKYS